MATLQPVTGNSWPLAAEYHVFAHPEFEAQNYAHSVINNEPYLPTSTEAKPTPGPSGTTKKVLTAEASDVTAALASLNTGIESLNRQIRTLVSTHHPDLLQRSSKLSKLSTSLTSVRSGLGEVEGSVERLRKKVTEPCQVLTTGLARLESLQRAGESVRRVARCVTLAKRLEGQMTELESTRTEAQQQQASSTTSKSLVASVSVDDRKERALGEIAVTLAELDSLLNEDTASDVVSGASPPQSFGASLRSLRALSSHLSFVAACRANVEEDIAITVAQGLVKLDQSLLAGALQAAWNLGILPSLVAGLVHDLNGAVEARTQNALDMAALAREAGVKESSSNSSSFVYKSRARTEPTSVTLPQWTSALWQRFESLMADISGCCIKVYTLEKVLEWKKDPASGHTFLDEILNSVPRHSNDVVIQQNGLEERPRVVFWSVLGKAMDRELRQASQTSTSLQQTFSTSYPKLLRLFHDFFAQIAPHTNTVYNSKSQSPETVMLLRSISPFEAMFLSKCSTRMMEFVSLACNQISNVVGRGSIEGGNVARAINNELDTCRFDPLLIKNVARKAKDVGEAFVKRIETMIARDYSATSLTGPNITGSQLINAECANALSTFSIRLTRILLDYPEPIRLTISPVIEFATERSTVLVTDPLTLAMKKDISSIMNRMHRLSIVGGSGNRGVGYIQDLTSKLTFLRDVILGHYRLGITVMKVWSQQLSHHVAMTWLLNASLLNPLNEESSMKLVGDVSEIDFSISQLVSQITSSTTSTKLDRDSDVSLGGEVEVDAKSLKGFRSMLCSDQDEDLVQYLNEGVPPLVVLHHIAIRSSQHVDNLKSIDLPHQVNGWSEAEYVKWIEEHEVLEDQLKMVEKVMGVQRHRDIESKWHKMAADVIEKARSKTL